MNCLSTHFRRRLLSLYAAFFLLVSFISHGQPIAFKGDETSFMLKDHVNHPFYWWPKTLLHYDLHFDAMVDMGDFSFTANGESVPFQFSRQEESVRGGWDVTLSFLSDLPSGAEQEFVLKRGERSYRAPVDAIEADGTILLKTNKLMIRIPASQRVTGQAPGPVISIYPAEGDRMGNSVFNPGSKKLVRIETEEISSGPVFTAYRISYVFDDGGRYIATVRAVQDYDFVELQEEMSGIEKTEKVSWELHWTALKPTHRQAPNHPFGQPGDEPGFNRFQWETIDQKMLNSHHGVMPELPEKGKMPFVLGLYQPWPAEKVVTSAMFWDERKGQSVGVFINDVAGWNDEDYPIWQSSRILDIGFFYRDGLLSFNYPVSRGTRSTAISCYPHENDIAYMDMLEEKSKPQKHPSGFNYRTRIAQSSYNTFLQNRYGTIHLNKVKDWVLYYPPDGKVPEVIFKEKDKTSIASLESFFYGGYTAELTFSGTRQNSGYSPVPARSFYEEYLPAYNQVYPTLSDRDDKARLAAMFLMHAYVSADEEYMPMKYMLSGHPNFLADVKTIPAMAAFLFPEHPEARNWADLFEKYVDLNTRWHTRPHVKSWNATGGRWTENLSAYTWAFLRPTLQTNFLMEKHDGKNRVAGVNTAMIGNFLLNSLSAPFEGESLDFYRTEKGVLDKHSWGVVTKDEGPARVHPPLGAHSIRRQPPRFFWALGDALENYDPLLAENIRYFSHPDDDNMTSSDREPASFDKIMYTTDRFDKGTPPDLRSIKLTGYGNILRARVGTPEELSIHLMQIDQGPNYRWGRAADGGTGTIYFYAGGKSYSNNGKEDIGDRRLEDTDLMTNFGVFKDGTFRSVGQNTLHRPLYDLASGQFAELVPSQDTRYSWPEYQSRSIMLIGADYFITYDDVYNRNIGARFSWFTHLDEDLPEIKVIKAGGTEDRNRVMRTEIKGPETKGVYYDGTNDFMVFISHKKGFSITAEPFGCRVVSPDGGTDHIYRNDAEVVVDDHDKIFKGTAGFMRTKVGSAQELALFHGERIGNGKFLIQSDDVDAGISAVLSEDGFISGKFYGPRAATITFSWRDPVAKGARVYVDGEAQPVAMVNNSFIVAFPAGAHEWQITKGLPIPVQSQILSSENDRGKVNLAFAPSAGSRKYRVELSVDNCETWKSIGESRGTIFRVNPVSGAGKSHVRVTAFNESHESTPSAAYPIYFTAEKPTAPDGLKVTLSTNGASVTWGEVLGVRTYTLYRRSKGEADYHLLYKGNNISFSDSEANTDAVYEYAVTSVNRNGESTMSHAVDTSPESWLHWNPKPGEPFRRSNTTFGVEKSTLYYPE